MVFTRSICTININSISCIAKKLLLRDFIFNTDIDILLLQEVAFESFGFLHSHTAIVNFNNDSIGTAILVRKGIEFSNVLMGSCGRILSVSIDNFNIINIYAASGTNRKKERDILFSSTIIPHLSSVKINIIAGDFNCILLSSDSNSTVPNFCKGLESLVKSVCLFDVEKEKNTSVQFTFIRGISMSRLDRFYAPKDFLSKVLSVSTAAVSFSDHHAVLIKYQVPDGIQLKLFGRGFWKINPSLIDNSDIHNKLITVLNELETREMFSRDLNKWWNQTVKVKIKQTYKSESFHLNQQIHREKNFYYACLKEIIIEQSNGRHVYDEMIFIKSKLLQIEHDRLKNFSLKIPPTSLASEETLSLFQISSSIKKNYSDNLLHLRTSKGITSDYKELKPCIENYFTKIFASESSNNLNNNFPVLNNINKSLNLQDSNMLIRPISKDELNTIIKLSAKKKSPGPDGLTYEFYEHFFDVLSDHLLKLFNSYLRDGVCPEPSFSEGIIALVPKNGDQTDISNKRPISMLNCDYKIFSKILANRLHAVLPNLIGPGQAACNPEKSCIYNLRLIRNICLRAEQTKRLKGLILSLDLEKAFDNVSHDFLWAVLKKYGFPNEFITCIQNLYKHASSKILFNGFLTNTILILNSVRQGCPLSMALFALYIEPLIRLIYDNVQGCFIANTFIKVIAYADDLNIFVLNDHEFDTVLELINYFSIFSKIKLNVRKSHFMRLNNCRSGPHMLEEKMSLKILGIVFYQNFSRTVDSNYNSIIPKFKNVLAQHSKRKLNLVQKCIVLNSYALSKIWYIAQIFPPSNKHLADIRKSCGWFIWTNFFKVDRNQLYLPLEKGGLGLEDPEVKAQSLFVKNIIFAFNDEKDSFMLAQTRNKSLTRNARAWLDLASELSNFSYLDSCKSFYNFLLQKRNTIPKVERENPEFSWEIIWENISKNFLSSYAKEALYMVYNNLVPNRSKMFRLKVRGVVDNLCEICNNVDSTEHRIKNCKNTRPVWEWVEEIISKRLKLVVEDPEEIMQMSIVTSMKRKACLWLVAEVICFNLKNTKNATVKDFQHHIRKIRWNFREVFKKHFGNLLNIC